MSNIIEIKQTPDQSAQTIGLGKYNKSKMPGCWEKMQPGIGPDSRWVTGIDENSYSLKKISDLTLRDQETKETKERRENLEMLTGLNLKADLSNVFWQEYLITIFDKLTLDLNNPNDLIKYHVLLANGYVAPELSLADTPEFMNAKYVMSRTDEEQTNLATRRRERDRAVAKLVGLMDNHIRLRLVAKFLIGSIVKPTMSVDGVYNLLSDYISDPKDIRNSKSAKFLSIVDKPIEELQYKITAIEATELNVIRFREGMYQRGQITYGKTIEKVTEFLTDPRNSLELESIIEEIKEKRIYG